LHDAAEAYIGDVATPLKNLLDDYAAIEKKVEQAVFAYFELSLPLSIFTKQADQIMLATEKRDLLPPSPDDWFAGTGIEPMTQKIMPLSSNVAKRLFLERYTHLTRIDVNAEAIEA
jgi:5'-deoxynucleotidase YfbR-like HD superfamily hydrolase